MQMLKCSECGAGIPVSARRKEVECRFCGSIYQVVRRRSHGKPSPGQVGWFVGGLIVGFALGWPISRALLATTAKVSLGELERKVAEWGRR